MIFVAEGDAETWDSWSGCSRSLVRALRGRGVPVQTHDAAMHGLRRWIAIAASISPGRRRWVQRYENSALAFRFRSDNARLATTTGGVVLQAGAGFHTPAEQLFCICDANAAFAARGGRFGPFAELTSREVNGIIARERRVYERCEAIFCFTEALRQSFIQDFGIPADRLITTYQGANLESMPSEETALRPRNGAPTILFVGRMFERKGGGTVVEAFRQLYGRMPEARLRIVGCRPEIHEPGIEVIGAVSRARLEELFVEADLYCQPSHYEPFGTAFVEAMLFGLPCIASREYGSEIVEEERTGWLVDAGDAPTLAELLHRVLPDRRRLREAGLAARNRALHLFRWERVAQLVAERMDRIA